MHISSIPVSHTVAKLSVMLTENCCKSFSKDVLQRLQVVPFIESFTCIISAGVCA